VAGGQVSGYFRFRARLQQGQQRQLAWRRPALREDPAAAGP